MTFVYEDPTIELLNRKREIERQEAQALSGSAIDDKELAEREEAAKAYAGENEAHFVTYLQDCIKTSVAAHEDLRQVQAHCYQVYKENEPVNYQRKEAWQSRIVVPKPFGTVQYGASAVKRAFTPKFLSVTNALDKKAGEFWQKAIEIQLNEQHAKFVLRFTDATTMGLAVGVSLEMIPRWVPGKGMEFVLVEPWKIHRDPDAPARDPQGGMYWIHQEWLDYFVLKEGENRGKYFNVARAKDTDSEDPQNEWMTKEAIAARKDMIWKRSDFRPMILTSEFWGIVLSPKGEMLLPNAAYTVAGGRVIEKPRACPYQYLRWPGIAFSPMPDLLKFAGRGLLEGVLTLWESMCNIMCLHEDNLKWVVNPMTEINVDGLVDPLDAAGWPGKEYLVRDTVSGQQVVRTVNRRGVTNEVLANMQYADQNFQRGTFVTDAVQGLPGYRKDMTYREAAMNLDQALGVYSLMGENIEEGAIWGIMAAAEFIKRYAAYADYVAMFGEERAKECGISPEQDPEKPGVVNGVPEISGSFHVSGIQALMKENETLTNLKNVVIPLANHPRFGPYIKPYKILKSLETRTNLTDEGVFATEEEAAMIEAQEYEELARQKRAAIEQQDIANAHAAADLATKVKTITAKTQAYGGEA
jgi:hypothetical protein